MKISTELKKMRKFRTDRQNLQNFLGLESDYASSIIEAQTQTELDSIKGEIEPLYRRLIGWKFHKTEYGYFRRDMERVKRLLDLIAARYDSVNGNGAKAEVVPLPASLDAKVEPSEVVVQSQELEKRLDTPQLQEVDRNPTLADLLNFYRHNRLVGEERTAILQTLGAMHSLCFGIESLSGSGKTYTLDILLDLLPEEDVYRVQQASPTALSYDADKVNKAKVIIFTELQKSAGSKVLMEILKDLGEGKSAGRIVTLPDRTGVVHQKIEAGKSVIYTLALENWFKKDRELERRYFQLYTDISEEQTRRILEAAAQREFMEDAELSVLSKRDIVRLREHVSSCMQLPDFRYVNPFAAVVIGSMPPKIKARSFVNHYFSLVQASTRFHHNDRVIEGEDAFVSLADAYYIHQLYGEQFFKSVLRIPIAGEDLLAVFNGGGYSNPSEIHRQLKRNKSPLTFPVVIDMLEELTEAGYLEKDDYHSRDSRYRKVSDINGFDVNIDWQQCFETGCGIMQQKFPGIYEKWLAAQLKDSKVMVLDPLQGQEVAIAEYR